jgi:hypothetical protein
MDNVNPDQRASDLQLIRDSWQTLWSSGRKQYRAAGRGALIILDVDVLIVGLFALKMEHAERYTEFHPFRR